MTPIIYNLTVDEFDETSGMFLVSMVADPAMEVEAVLLSTQSEPVALKATDVMKQYMTSAVIIPDKPIVRFSEDKGKHYVKFTKDDVEKIRNKFFRQTGNIRVSNKNHVASDTVAATMIQSWVVKDSNIDTSVALGFQPFPVGTWMATYEIHDKSFWDNEVMTGNITGFSLEGMFNHVPTMLSTEPESWEDAETAVDNILALLFTTDGNAQD